ncbi:hypothetical protein Tco_1215516 [Tanacetum coccineum]
MVPPPTTVRETGNKDETPTIIKKYFHFKEHGHFKMRLRDQLLDIKNEKDKISFDNISTEWLYFDRLLNTKADVEEFRVNLSTLEVKNSRCTIDVCSLMIECVKDYIHVSDIFECKILFLKDDVNGNEIDSASLFMAVYDSVFETAMFLYKKRKEEFCSTNMEKIFSPITKGPEFVSPSDEEKGGYSKPMEEGVADVTLIESTIEKDEPTIQKLDVVVEEHKRPSTAAKPTKMLPIVPERTKSASSLPVIRAISLSNCLAVGFNLILNDDEDAMEELYSLVTVAGLKGLGTKVIEDED